MPPRRSPRVAGGLTCISCHAIDDDTSLVARCSLSDKRCANCCLLFLHEAIKVACPKHFRSLSVADKNWVATGQHLVESLAIDSDMQLESSSDDELEEVSRPHHSSSSSSARSRSSTQSTADDPLIAMNEQITAIMAALGDRGLLPGSRRASLSSGNVTASARSDGDLHRLQAHGVSLPVQQQIGSYLANPVSRMNTASASSLLLSPSTVSTATPFDAFDSEEAIIQRMKKEVLRSVKPFKSKAELKKAFADISDAFLQQGSIIENGVHRPLTLEDVRALGRLEAEVIDAANSVSLSFATEYLKQLKIWIQYTGLPRQLYWKEEVSTRVAQCWLAAEQMLKAKEIKDTTSTISHKRGFNLQKQGKSKRRKVEATDKAADKAKLSKSTSQGAFQCPVHPNANHLWAACNSNAANAKPTKT